MNLWWGGNKNLMGGVYWEDFPWWEKRVIFGQCGRDSLQSPSIENPVVPTPPPNPCP